MPRVLVAVLVCSAAAAVVVVLVRRGGDDPAARLHAVTLVGDSLDVGTAPYLEQELRGWKVRDDGVVGRRTDDGVEALRRLQGRDPVVISLGTNDPRGGSAAFAADVARALRVAGAGRCVVWATIWRDGGPDTGFNDVLRRAADDRPALRVLPWAELVEAHPDWLAPDGIHGTPEGYRGRAAAAARLVRDCPVGAAG